MKIITLKEVEYLSFVLAQKLLKYDEPIPDFSTRFPNVLESCLAVPFQQFSQKDMYRGLIQKATILFYLMIKNHPFKNGNKRIAITTLFVFLYKNGQWLAADQRELCNFALWVAQSPAELKDEVVEGINKFLTRHLIELKV